VESGDTSFEHFVAGNIGDRITSDVRTSRLEPQQIERVLEASGENLVSPDGINEPAILWLSFLQGAVQRLLPVIVVGVSGLELPKIWQSTQPPVIGDKK
jgi:hypothetical protein